MLRTIMMACIAGAAIATVAIPMDASARGRGGGGHRGGGFHHHGGFRGGFGPSFGFYPYGAYGVGCYRTVRVYTPYGPRLRRVWVC